MPKKARWLGATMSVSLVVLCSKALGFFRDIIMANMHGTSGAMDAYNAAYGIFYIPILLLSSCITSTLVPLYIQAREKDSMKEANRFASNAISIFSVICIVITAAMMVFARPLVDLIHGGFDAEIAELTVKLVRIMLPGLLFFVLAVLLSSVLNANKRFIPAQLTGFPLSFALIVTTILSDGPDGIEMLAWGVAAAGLLQTVVVYPFARKDYRYSLRLDVRDERFKKMMAMAVPAFLSMAVNELNHMIDRSLASGLPVGSISSMNYAFKLITFALGVLIVPLTTVMFSRMSERAAKKDTEGMIRMLLSATETVLMVTVPITVLGCVLSRDVIALAYGRGNFGEESIRMTSGVFAYYLVGLTAFALRDLFNRAFHSVNDTRLPMYVAGGSVVLNVILNVILVKVMGANGLALATSISGLLGAVTLLLFLRRRMGGFSLGKLCAGIGKILVCGGVCAAVTILLGDMVPEAANILQRIGRLILICGVGIAAYALAALATGVGGLKRYRKKLLRF